MIFVTPVRFATHAQAHIFIRTEEMSAQITDQRERTENKMAEYIKKEDFKNKYLCFGYLPEMSEQEFDAFPSADVAPVVHGRWEAERLDMGRYCALPVGPHMSAGTPGITARVAARK